VNHFTIKPAIISALILVYLFAPNHYVWAEGTSSNSYYLRGNKYLLKKKVDKAIDNYNKAIRLRPKEPKYYYKRAQAYRSKGLRDEAITNYKKVIEIDPTYYWAYSKLADIFVETGNNKKAISYYEICVFKCPRESEKHYYRGRICDISGEIDEAISEYKQALKQRPDYFDALSCIAENYEKKQDLKMAASYYLRAKRLRCYDEATLIKLGIVYTKLKEFQKALKILNVALLINPFNRDTRFYLGKAFYGKGNLNHAIKQTKKALEVEPNDPEIHFTLGLYYDKKGWHDMAVAEYQEALYLKPDYLFNKLEKLNRKKNLTTEGKEKKEEREKSENGRQSSER